MSRSIPPARIAVTTVLVVWMVVGPVLGQGFGINRPYLTAWHMFRTWGTGTMEVQFYQRTPNGDVPLNRLQLLGHTHWRTSGVDRIVVKRSKVRKQAQRICDVLGTPADVRADVISGTVQGWKKVMSREKNLCR